MRSLQDLLKMLRKDSVLEMVGKRTLKNISKLKTDNKIHTLTLRT